MNIARIDILAISDLIPDTVMCLHVVTDIDALDREYDILPMLINYLRIEGGFGEDSADRGEVVAIAVSRLRQAMHSERGNDRSVIVVGDTPHDVAAAHTNGYKAVAVATGFSSYEELLGTGAELVFKDFGNCEAVYSEILGLVAPGGEHR